MADQDQQAGLDAINALRAKYGLHPLQWDQQCAYDAYIYAQKLAKMNRDLVHDVIPQEKGQAECLAMQYNNYKPDPNVYKGGVLQWWDTKRDTGGNAVGPGEEDMYFNDPERKYHFLNWGHFAIMVSKQADKCGLSFGVADSDSPNWPQGGRQIYVVLRVHGAYGVSNQSDQYERVEHQQRR